MEKNISEMDLQELRFHYTWVSANCGDRPPDQYVLAEICDRFVELTGPPVMEQIEEALLGSLVEIRE